METISAIATPRGCGGVAIIRVSGEEALNIAAKMFKPFKNISVENFTPYVMYVGDILCDGFTDYGMCVYFKAPSSLTGEDVVEFHCHGGERITRAVLQKTFDLGARPADRGEFTKRAFLNGKLSLASAEGLVDMINAESDASLRAGNMLFRKKSVEGVVKAQDELKYILASLAADCDYPEEGVAESDIGDLPERLNGILNEINALIATYPRGKFLSGGVNVALCGNPNVGKSSLLNALLGYDKAIVSDEAGTTRDAVEGTIYINGVAFKLVDTAGLRQTTGKAESAGIEIAKRAALAADVVVYVSDGGECEMPQCDAGKVIKVFNKTDILTAPEGYDAAVSAATGDGIEGLKKLLYSKIPQATTEGEAIICEERHFNALKRAAQSLTEAITGAQRFPLDVIVLDLNEAWSALGEITGETANESIIDEVFSKFCVGK